MATIGTPTIQFAPGHLVSRDRVKVSFVVKFNGSELAGRLSPALRGRYHGLLSQFGAGVLPKKRTYPAKVSLRVIRAEPILIVTGQPPPLPTPVVLSTTTLNVALPTSGNTRSVSTQFDYRLGLKKPLATDHLHAYIELSGRFKILPDLFTYPIDSKVTNDLVLLGFNLASPQPDGTIIP